MQKLCKFILAGIALLAMLYYVLVTYVVPGYIRQLLPQEPVYWFIDDLHLLESSEALDFLFALSKAGFADLHLLLVANQRKIGGAGWLRQDIRRWLSSKRNAAAAPQAKRRPNLQPH